MRNTNFLLALIITLITGFEARADVKLPAIISNNMLLQQQSDVNIWGEADPKESVRIKSSWSSKIYTTVADKDGKWLIKINTPKATTNQSITIEAKNTIQIDNILIGEVWLCSGQSNMDFPIAKSKGWRTGILNEEDEMKDADYPEIRLFHVAQKLSPEKELDDCEGQWMICNPDNLKDFSAVAFIFGRELYKKLNKTPIGLIQSTWGGTHAESWTKMSVMENDPVYSDLMQDFYTSRDNYPADMKKYEEDYKKYEIEKQSDNTVKAPKKPQGINHNKALSTLWNGMIYPLVPYTIKGTIWYQGESNSVRYHDYTHVFTKMIDSWRNEWKQRDLPFYFVQIAPHYKQPPQIREAQLQTWQSVKKTGMVVITDGGDSTDIHPRNKELPGLRLAKWALANDYGKNISYSGPLYHSMKIKGNSAVLSFDHTDKGLSSQGELLKGFMIAGSDHQFYPATATIKGNTVVVSSAEIDNPIAVRYGWDKFFRVNLYNGAGLPATPFRTDNWTD